MNDKEFENWTATTGISERGRNLLERIRTSPPARQVQSGGGNVSGFYPSKKMGHTINFESHTVELCGIYELEHDGTVLEYFDQPYTIKLNYTSRSGRRVGTPHTPDFLAIRTDSAGFEEWKTEEKLVKLADESPNRYVKGEDGIWRCPPGQEFAAQYGLYYRVRSTTDIDWVFQNNIRFLEDYLRDEVSRLETETTNAIMHAVRISPGINLADLIVQNDSFAADDVYYSLITDMIYMDLKSYVLNSPKQTRVFINRETAVAYEHIALNTHTTIHSRVRTVDVAVGALLVWDSIQWTVINVGTEDISIQSANGNVANLPYSAFDEMIRQGKISTFTPPTTDKRENAVYDIISKAGPQDLEIASFRYSEIYDYIHDIPGQADKSPAVPRNRTMRRWIEKYRAASRAYGNGFVGLIPQTAKKGNRNPKISDDVKQIINEVIEYEYENKKQIDLKTAYGHVHNKCEKVGLIPPSYRTFSSAVRMRPFLNLIKQRRGPKAAYAQESAYWYLDLTVPRHGSRPWEICHLDHTEVDLELVDDHSTNLGRPYLSVLMDAYSRRVLAFDISFEKPSYRTCMKVLRDCVRRHGRLPDCIVVDGGKEFHSVYFDALLAHYDCIKKTRPPAKPKFGSLIERFFGTLNTMLFHNLSGNTQLTHDDVRQVTKDYNPKHLASWTLPRVYNRLNEFFFTIYDTIKHPALMMAPRDAYNSTIVISGTRPYRRIAYDETFVLSTLPTTKKGTVKVDSSRGVKVNNIYYWCNDFKNPKVRGSQVPVKYDPYDMGVAYVYVFNHWVKCISEYYLIFKGRTERELAITTEIIRKQRTEHSRGFAVTAARLAAFLQSTEAENILEMQRARDAAAKQIANSVTDLNAEIDATPERNNSPAALITEDDPLGESSGDDIAPAGVYIDD